MENNKFCFIMCTNNDLLLEEAIHYINHLEVPEGYETDLLTVQGARCMAAGYNEAMAQSDAKYKIYMHQDTFILNPHFLQDILDIFHSDEKIGMIGMVGSPSIPKTGVMWQTERVGTNFSPKRASEYPKRDAYRYSVSKDGYDLVAEIDGFMMITSKDVEWNEKDLDGWDFYDVFQSMNFLENGYKIVVPKQNYPWCMHDDGVLLNLKNYDKYRKRFLAKYQPCLGKRVEEIDPKTMQSKPVQQPLSEREATVSDEDVNKNLDPTKVLLIICANNMQYLEQCIWYLEQLEVPDGMTMDVVSIQDAPNIIDGYNEGMNSSDAKYKIYIHQDTFILNKHLIRDILSVFQSDEKVAMLGVIGGDVLPKNAMVWNYWNQGVTYGCDFQRCRKIVCNQSDGKIPYKQGMGENAGALALDGMFLATQYDLKWRDDLGFKWDGYDVSQSLEFVRRGYKLIVPYQEEIWCLHDCGPSNLINYEKTRQVFLTEYEEFFGAEFEETTDNEFAIMQKKLFEVLWGMVQKGQIEAALMAYKDIERKLLLNKELRYLESFFEIFEEEKNLTIKEKRFLQIDSWEMFKEKYDYYKFLLRRVEFGDSGAYASLLCDDIYSGAVSLDALNVILQRSIYEQQKVVDVINTKLK